MDVIRIKLQRDILKMSLEYVSELDIDKEEFTKWVQPFIETYSHTAMDEFKPKEIQIDESKCIARLWNDGRQCSFTKMNDTYCGHHIREIKINDLLRFGNMKEPRPDCDQVKQNGEVLNWKNPNHIEELETILNVHKRKVAVASKHLLTK